MSAPADDVPTISQVYDAFDEAANRVFRLAMRKSRGGVVRVEDLKAALAESVPGLARWVVGGTRRRPGPQAREPDRPPMANEPALAGGVRAAGRCGARPRDGADRPVGPASATCRPARLGLRAAAEALETKFPLSVP